MFEITAWLFPINPYNALHELPIENAGNEIETQANGIWMPQH